MATPEERFNQEVWEILQKIEVERLATVKGKPVEYKFPIRHFAGVGIISQERQKQILYKLQEWGALRIREDPFEPPESTPHVFSNCGRKFFNPLLDSNLTNLALKRPKMST